MRSARRVLLEAVGWLLVVGGIAALVLPGPGLLMLFGGMAILSQQYAWAERRLRPVEVRAMKTAADSVQTWPRVVLSTLGGLALVGIGLLWTIHPAAPGWWPFADRWWLIGGWPTGVTLMVSGVVALALIVYSFRRFRGVEDPERAAELSAEN